MKQIKLQDSDKFAIVDDSDYDRCSEFQWYFNGSAVVQKKTQIPISNFILQTNRMIDHKDRDRYNNLRSNLRICNMSKNQANRTKFRKNATSKYKGVYLYKITGKWRATIMHQYKNIHLGFFNSEDDAAKAYDKKAKEIFGEFAVLNFSDSACIDRIADDVTAVDKLNSVNLTDR